MTAIDYATAMLETDEGYREFVYNDITGKATIGYGFCLEDGITMQEAAAMLNVRVQALDKKFMSYPWYAGLNDVRKSALLDMAYNLGLHGFLEFKDMIVAIQAQDWTEANNQCLNSSAARLLPTRYGRLADMLLTGNLPGE